MISRRKSMWMGISSVAGCLLYSSPAATAGLNIDLRATGVVGSGVVVNAKNVQNVQVGSIIRFDIFAVVSGTNTTTSDDKFISVSGSLRTSTGFALGNLAGDIVRSTTDPNTGEILSAGFDGAGFSVGTLQDLDGDTDLDVGSNIDSDANHFWAARYAIAGMGVPAGSTNPTSGGRRIGFGTFTATASGLAMLINFDGRGAATAANYIMDGQIIQEPSLDGLLPIVLNGGICPEPAALGIAGLTGLALLRSRRGANMTGVAINR